MLKLPPGFVPQVNNRREVGFKSYEFNFVYGPDGRLDVGRSFWVMTPLDKGEQPEAREITYAQHQAAAGRAALSFEAFGAHDMSAARIEEWLQGQGAAKK